MKIEFPKALTTLLLLIMNSMLIGQESHPIELNHFKVTIVKTANGVSLESTKGSAWLNLSYSTDYDIPQAIDEYGMTKLDNVSPIKDANLADYLFTITKTKNGIQLIGIQGTAWETLSFSLSHDERQAINQFGMIK